MAALLEFDIVVRSDVARVFIYFFIFVRLGPITTERKINTSTYENHYILA